MTQTIADQTPAPDDRPHRAADDTEQVFFEGSPLLRADLHLVLIWGVIGIAIFALLIANLVKWKIGVPWWGYAVGFVIGVIAMFVPVIMRKTLKYRITNYRIDIQTGVLTRNIATIELWHVEDLRLHQSLLNRIAGVGSISITAHDQTLPVFQLVGLPRPVELFKMLEQRVISVKRQRGVMKVDPG